MPARGVPRNGVGASVGLPALTLEKMTVLCPDRTPDILEVNEALDQLAKVDERKAKVIESCVISKERPTKKSPPRSISACRP